MVATIIVVFGVLYLLNPEPTESTESTLENTSTVGMTGTVVETVADASIVSIQTNPPQGRVYIDNVEVGVAPVEWVATEGSIFMMCVDWGSNPILPSCPKTDLSGQYTFEQVLTP